MKRFVTICVVAFLANMGGAFAAFAGSAPGESLPKVWMSTQWREPAEETIRMCAEQGVDAVEVPTWSKDLCARLLPLLRKYKVKGFTSSGYDTSMDVRDVVKRGVPHERAVFSGGAYRGKAMPPVQTAAEKATLAKELKKYPHIVCRRDCSVQRQALVAFIRL